MSGTIKVVIVTYNSAEQIESCLDALACSSERYSFDINVVDNGSTDDTLVKLRTRYPAVQVTESTNLGYAHGCNLALRETLKSGREYKAVLILNPDVTLPRGCADQLVDTLLSSHDIAGVSPHVVEQPGRENERLKTFFGLQMNEKPLPGRDAVVSDRLHGCCMLLRPDIFRKIGLIEEQYFLYWEELDFGLRAIAAGFKLLLCYDVIVYHRYATEERPHRIYYMWRNQFLFVKRNFGYFLKIVFSLRRSLSCLKEISHFALSGRFDLVNAAMAGLVAGFHGETGKSANIYANPVPLKDSERK